MIPKEATSMLPENDHELAEIMRSLERGTLAEDLEGAQRCMDIADMRRLLGIRWTPPVETMLAFAKTCCPGK